MGQLRSDHLRRRVAALAHGEYTNFELLAADIYRLQSEHCQPYRKWLSHFPYNPTEHSTVVDIPRLPISAWKLEKVRTGTFDPAVTYTSSGTSGSTTARHAVRDESFYIKNAIAAFEKQYGPVKERCIVGLLPSYMERTGSSLVSMVQAFIDQSNLSQSGTYLYDHASLHKVLTDNSIRQVPTVLIGVSFALLDFVEQYSIRFPELIVMETGGMKGRKEELTRSQLHRRLTAGFGVSTIHSEYGMTELLSQSYSTGQGIFRPAATKRVIITEMNDPLTVSPYGKAGIINIIDLANVDSCSFIITEDIGVGYADGSFEVLGRLDTADLRGCNLMVSDL